MNLISAGMLDLLFESPSVFPKQDDIQKALLPNGWTFLAHIVATILVLLIIMKLIWKPLQRSLQARRQHIEKQITEAEKINQEAQHARVLTQQRLEQINAESERAIESARAEGYRIRDELEHEAKQYATRIRTDAHEEIKGAEARMRQDLRHEIIDVAMLAVNNVIESSLDEKQERELIEDFLEQLESTDLKVK